MSRRPADDPFKQQRLADLQPRVTINGVIAVYFIIGIIFIPVGVYLRSESNGVAEYSIQYDGTDSDVSTCSIDASNADESCTLSFQFTEDVTGPLYVYYQVDHFYQNHRRYVKSRSSSQLMGENLAYDDVYSDCYPMTVNGSILLNPCGLIANTFFTDIISLSADSTSSGYVLDTDGIAWSYDTDAKFAQVDGFVSAAQTNSSSTCAEVLGSSAYDDCSSYTDSSGDTYMYWYPDDSTVQYLHESFPDQISPLDGVTDEHFINWMRTAGLPGFRKLYGKIDSDFSAGDSLSFDLALNFEVSSYGGTKSLVLTNLGVTGAKSTSLGNAYLFFGSLSLFIGLLFALKRIFKPRPLGDIRELSWNSY